MPLLEWTICYLAWLFSPLYDAVEWMVKIYWGWEISFTKKSLGGQLHLRYGCKESSETFYCSRNMQNICLVRFYNDSLVAYFSRILFVCSKYQSHCYVSLFSSLLINEVKSLNIQMFFTLRLRGKAKKHMSHETWTNRSGALKIIDFKIK